MHQINFKNKEISRGNKPIELIFLHGFMGSLKDWDSIIRRLEKESDLSFKIGRVDLPGHGKSDRFDFSKYPDFDTIIEIIYNTIINQGFQNPTLIGYSLGGRVALSLALKFPHFCHSLIIESSSPGITCEQAKLRRLKQDEILFREVLEKAQSFHDFLNEWYSKDLFFNLNTSGFKETLKRRLANNPEILQKSIKALSVGNMPSLWDKLKDVTIPILYLSGEKDKKYQEIARKIETNNRSISFKTVTNAGHNTHVQNEDCYFQFIMETIQKVKTSTPNIKKPDKHNY